MSDDAVDQDGGVVGGTRRPDGTLRKVSMMVITRIIDRFEK